MAIAKPNKFHKAINLLRGTSNRTYGIRYLECQRELVRYVVIEDGKRVIRDHPMGPFIQGTEQEKFVGPFRYQQYTENRLIELMGMLTYVPGTAEIVEYMDGVMVTPQADHLGQLVLFNEV